MVRCQGQLWTIKKQVRIAVDAMGGDHAPGEIVAGAVLAVDRYDLEILLVGEGTRIKQFLPPRANKITIVEAEGQIDMHEEPLDGIRKKAKASINVVMDLLKRGEAEAVVSAGHTGAAMASALLKLGRLPGVDRPAIGALLPTLIPHKPVLLLDVGANVDCRPKFLCQFATMGVLFSRLALGVKEPKLGLLNIGEEACKGNDLAVQVHQLLQQQGNLPFIGNAEGRDVMSGKFDVIVCDGFTGNVLLKFAEGVGLVAMQILKEELPRGWQGQLGCAVLRSNLGRVKERMDYAEYGGGLLLGVRGICVIGHGSSKAPGLCSSIRVAREAVQNQVLDQLQQALQTPVLSE